MAKLPRWKSVVPQVTAALARVPKEYAVKFDTVAERIELFSCGCKSPRESGRRSGIICDSHRALVNIAHRFAFHEKRQRSSDRAAAVANRFSAQLRKRDRR